ncbi:hypothetical protein LWI29_012023 [Acer saccharum]|uniref:Uncharacterized protein n=1 Tax=Acer saccharum TaxID=4024 RepID=A0AA39SS60_ACESA|nr:hypothetical protein LWI29_012023 [Acer saccharum]
MGWRCVVNVGSTELRQLRVPKLIGQAANHCFFQLSLSFSLSITQISPSISLIFSLSLCSGRTLYKLIVP